MKRIIRGIPHKLLATFLLVGTLSSAPLVQAWVTVHDQGCCDGYTLINSAFPSLIDMNGTLIHRWNTFFPQPAKLFPGGFLITGMKYKFCGLACGDATTLEELDWNGTIVWSYNGREDGRARQHHDFEREGNSVGYYAPGQDVVSNGTTLILSHHTVINTSISKRQLSDEVIYEINWDGTPTGFEWHASEHFNQMGFDNTSKHGIFNNPGILGDGDYLHMNSMSVLGENKWYTMDPTNYSCFNPENIIVSSRNGDFIAIISKHTGDIVWRVGPYYSNDTEAGRKLGQIIGLHHAHMIPQGLPGAGDILLFDNGGVAGYGYFGMPDRFRLWSRVIEFNPVTFDIVWQYSYPTGNWWFPRSGDGHKFFSYYISSAQRLPNGNTLISEGSNGRVFEVTNTSKIVWDYEQPFRVLQVYRAYRVPPEWVPGNPSGYASWGTNVTLTG